MRSLTSGVRREGRGFMNLAKSQRRKETENTKPKALMGRRARLLQVLRARRTKPSEIRRETKSLRG